jgi:signal transduction histidine kinase
MLQARESVRFTAVGTTAVHLTHHLGNCFNNLSVSVQLLERRLAAAEHDPRCIPIVRELRDEITRALSVLADLRLLSDVQAPRLQSTAVAAVVSGVVHAQASGFAARGVRVIVDVPLTLPPAWADPEQLAQVVLNLCANAVEAMPQGGTLTLRADATEHRCILEVRDTGGGIPPGLKVFEPFCSTKPNKTGLGLAIAQRLMAAQHGTVTYTSPAGQGTTFTLTFPLAPARGGAASP